MPDCNQAVKLRSSNAYALDSRGLAELKLGQFDKAIADYNSALELRQKSACSLYGRGLARLKSGDKTGNSDISQAISLDSYIVDTFKAYKVEYGKAL